ncbi:MAG: DNA cytosine methyltransferase [Rubrivivax sp.]|nr:DNA cytosine methyltransferase [Rubrivivax sp.]
MKVQHALLRRLGEHRGSPRLYLDTPALAAAGFSVGAAWSIEMDARAHRLTLRVCGAEASSPAPQSRKVSGKRRGARVVPVIDLNGADHLRGFVELGGVVRIILCAGVIFVLAAASALRARRRADRLLAKARCGEPLLCAGIAFGAGVASKALHEGLAAAGVRSRLALANEASEVYLDIARAANKAVTAAATTAAMPMQELARDAWLLAQVPAIDILEAGIPCSGASRAGVAKRGLAKMEDHPLVGHLIGAAIELIATLQPAIVLVENVVDYRSSASAAILRGWLRDAGYAIAEAELDASEFGSLERRVRWFLVASPPELGLSFSNLQQDPQTTNRAERLADILEPIGPDDPRWHTVDYLKHKAERDTAAGKHFAMQVVELSATHVPTLRKGYHKGGSTDPRLAHPSDPSRSRLLTAAEHARIKGIDAALIDGVPETIGHQICGQAVDTRPVQAIGRRIAMALRAAAASQRATGGQRSVAAPFGASTSAPAALDVPIAA